METVLPKKERWIPPSVLRAKARADHAELSRLGTLGNAAKKERQHWREQQGVLPLQMKRQKQPTSCKRQPLTPEQKAQQAETRYINKVRREELAAIALSDAERHAEANRVGWCDEDT